MDIAWCYDLHRQWMYSYLDANSKRLNSDWTSAAIVKKLRKWSYASHLDGHFNSVCCVVEHLNERTLVYARAAPLDVMRTISGGCLSSSTLGILVIVIKTSPFLVNNQWELLFDIQTTGNCRKESTSEIRARRAKAAGRQLFKSLLAVRHMISKMLALACGRNQRSTFLLLSAGAHCPCSPCVHYEGLGTVPHSFSFSSRCSLGPHSSLRYQTRARQSEISYFSPSAIFCNIDPTWNTWTVRLLLYILQLISKRPHRRSGPGTLLYHRRTDPNFFLKDPELLATESEHSYVLCSEFLLVYFVIIWKIRSALAYFESMLEINRTPSITKIDSSYVPGPSRKKPTRKKGMCVHQIITILIITWFAIGILTHTRWNL